MRRVMLRYLMVQEGGAERPMRFEYGALCRQVVTSGTQQGYSFVEMLALQPLVHRLDRAIAEKREEVLLEEEEHKLLVRALRGFRWSAYSDAVIEMVREIEAAPEVDVVEAS